MKKKFTRPFPPHEFRDKRLYISLPALLEFLIYFQRLPPSRQSLCDLEIRMLRDVLYSGEFSFS